MEVAGRPSTRQSTNTPTAGHRLTREQLLRRHIARVKNRCLLSVRSPGTKGRKCYSGTRLNEQSVHVVNRFLLLSTTATAHCSASDISHCSGGCLTTSMIVQALLEWQHLTQQEKLEGGFLQVFTPEVADALALPPKQRQRNHVEAIYQLASKQRFASTIPRDALYGSCRHMTYEVIHDEMVLLSRYLALQFINKREYYHKEYI